MQHHVFTIAKVCQQAGVENAVICPGSRSAPLVYAFTQNPQIKCISVIDERSAGFIALGLAQQLQKPVVLICTSGTAGLNFFPAIAEAYYQKIPLLVLTADRPPELLNQQDGQMIMQKHMYGKHVLSSHELMCFEEDKVDYKLTERIVFSAVEECISDKGFGPVHINVPLREPLYDFGEEEIAVPKLTHKKEPTLTEGITLLPNLNDLGLAWKESRRKLLIIGQMSPNKELEALLNSFMNQDDVVVLSDIVSNQHECCNAPLFDSILQYHERLVLGLAEPDLIISFGGPLVSKALKNWLKKQKPAYHFRIQPNKEPIDTYQNVTHQIQAELLPYLKAFHSLRIFQNPLRKPFTETWKLLNKNTANALIAFHQKQIWCEPTALAHFVQYLPDNSMLQLANSSTVRWVSWNGIPLKGLHIFCNRGTSGIDGSTSTAIGAALAMPNKMVTFITGDLALFYDQNAFWQKQLPSNLRIVVINNQGGNIFNWIDGPSSHPAAIEYFTTPQQLSVKLMAEQYKLNYFSSAGIIEMSNIIQEFYAAGNGPSILELKFEPTKNNKGISEFRKIHIQ